MTEEKLFEEQLQDALKALDELKARREAEVIKYQEFVDFTIKAGLVTEKDLLIFIAIMFGVAISMYFVVKWFIGMVVTCGG